MGYMKNYMSNLEIKEDLILMINNLKESDFNEILIDSFKESIYFTFTNKGHQLIKIIKSIPKVIKSTSEFLKSIKIEDIKKFKFKKLLYIPKNILSESKKIIQEKYTEFNNLTFKEKKGKIVNVLLFSLMTLITAGGVDLEGGVPDLDIKLFGIGGHRNIFFHSIIIGFILEFSLRFILKLVQKSKEYGYLPSNIFWKTIYNLSLREDVLVNGAWIGLSLHFFKDANIFGGRVKPYSGIRGKSMSFHKRLFATNGLIAGIFGIKKKDNN
ncbi:hypothetical protein [Marinitoga aeolica]|uniref:Uncharacterized protein n=1 Tax=Marinitoga aeolica TaxID=2809031 RepID=A0ABY8PRC3_9BACT|nr:hypothetical protein [Marinitoga aeolica]WGS65196.1 hypothetical protein JRV97_01165 [Marinitoga aeolica]